MADVEAGGRQHDNGQGDQPMRDPHRNFPDVHADDLGGPLSAHATLTRASSRRVVSTTWTPQAMQGSKEWTVRRISIGRCGSATGVPRSASSYGPRRPLPSRGPAFHVLGTTH